MKKKIGLILGIFLFCFCILGCIKQLLPNEQIKDIQKYEEILGSNGRYKENLVRYNDIFPNSLQNVSMVEDFVYVYYNPWDPNYFGYLVCTYSDEQYKEEIARLKKIESTEYQRIYGIESFTYEVCAIYADEIYGVIYALADEQQQKIVYVALEFCNYFTDIAYEKKMDKKYLPEGFDAKPGNVTRKEFEHNADRTTYSVYENLFEWK